MAPDMMTAEQAERIFNDSTKKLEELNRIIAPVKQQGLIPFVNIAIDKGFHVFALTPKDKHPLPGSQGFKDSKAPDDPQVLSPWNEDPTRNIGINLGASDVTVLDFDQPEHIPAWLNDVRTYKVKTAKGVHIYFRGTHKTTKLRVDGEVVGDVKSIGGYTLAEGSVHPDGPVYTAIENSNIIALPERVSELLKQSTDTVTASTDGAKIPRGSHDNELTRIAGKLRQDGLEEEAIYNAITEVCEKRCENYGSDYREMARKIAKSVCKYPIKPVGQIEFEAVSAQAQTPPTIEIPKIEIPGHPVFPTWIFKGCQVYDHYVKEVCEQNSRYPEFMMVPALATILNYLGTKTKIGMSPVKGGIVNLIGKKGRVIKSSSVEDVFSFYKNVGILEYFSPMIRNAEGRSLVFTVGSTEGLGAAANKTNCRNMILYFDELKTLSDKAGIEGSSMSGHLLTLTQSGQFANETKSPKTNFYFEAGTYSGSLITCCTDRTFPKYWSKMIAFADGLQDRTTMVLQPETLKPLTPRVGVAWTKENIEEERRLINTAIGKSFEIEEPVMIEDFISSHGNRNAIRVEEWALAFAVENGKNSIDGASLEKAIALEKYNIQVKKFLNIREAETREAVIQNHIVQVLMQNQGRVTLRELNKRIHSDRLGASVWEFAYGWLIKSGRIMETGTGKPGDPKMVVLLEVPESDDDE